MSSASPFSAFLPVDRIQRFGRLRLKPFVSQARHDQQSCSRPVPLEHPVARLPVDANMRPVGNVDMGIYNMCVIHPGSSQNCQGIVPGELMLTSGISRNVAADG